MSFIYGMNPVREAIRAGRKISVVWVARGQRAATQRLLEEAAKHGVRVRELTRTELDARVGHADHQGVLAELAEEESGVRYGEVGEMLALAKESNEAPLIVLVDSVQDPRNLGAIIRCAYAFGAHGLVVPLHRSAPVTAVSIKTAAGATAHLPIARVTNLKHALDELRDAGVWSVAATLDGDPADGLRLDGPIALVVGAEDKGVRKTVGEACDMRARIELARDFDSLNAAVAAGVLLYEIQRQRRHGSS
ncbi:MAG: 23S rRNA (guanosine(2251)-2'-O)-methyltransferase RlmB [Myxococcota bacterium]